MKKYVLKFYAIGLFISFIIVIGLFITFRLLDTFVTDEIQRHLLTQSAYISKSINSELHIKAKTVDNVAHYIESGDNLFDEDMHFNYFEEARLLNYLKEILSNDEELSSLYLGSVNNKMINASGWIPPADFDLRTRPWYIKAKNENELIFTDIYINASNDKYIITIAKPVYNQESDLLGVVGADLSLDTIIGMITNHNDNFSQVFLVDSNQTIIEHSGFLEAKQIDLKDVSSEFSMAFNNLEDKIIPTSINGEQGYGYLSKIEGTNIILGVFIPQTAYTTYKTQWNLGLAIAIALLAAMFLLMLRLQKNLVIEPAINLEMEIKNISLVDNLKYRLPEKENDPFVENRRSINTVLSQAEDYFYQLKYNQEKLKDSNEELVATLEQLKAYEQELKQQQKILLDTNKQLKRSEKRNNAILNVLPDLLFVYDSKGNFLDCQTNHNDQLIFAKEEFIGKNIVDILPKDIADAAIKCIKEALSSEKIASFEYTLMINNQQKYFETRMVCSDDNQVLAIVRDITLEKIDKERILELSYKDHLTGLYNRRYFEEELLKMNKQEFLPMAFIMIDVNGLKLTNDAFGHLLGDELLKKVTANIKTCCSEDGFAARIGGDEFIIVCPNCNEAQAEEIDDKLHQKINKDKLENIVISISSGWEIRNSLKQTFREIYTKAENHMFRKKIVDSQSMRNKTIQVIMQTLNEKNEREKIHSVQVSEWSRKIGEAMSLNSQIIKEIETAGLVHDIGKISVREDVLNKPGKLTIEEYNEIKKHSESGYQILKSVDAYSSLAEYVLAHHERYDGKGYPRGLKGEDIPLIARIICVADAFEAMISDRPYRKGMTLEIALEEIKRCSGTQFDPEIAKIFISLFE